MFLTEKAGDGQTLPSSVHQTLLALHAGKIALITVAVISGDVSEHVITFQVSRRMDCDSTTVLIAVTGIITLVEVEGVSQPCAHVKL